MEAWVNPSGAANDWRTVMFKEQTGGPGLRALLEHGLQPAERPCRRRRRPQRERHRAVAANTWTHLAATYDGANLRLYVNGTQVGDAWPTGSMSASTGVLRIGGNDVWWEWFQGLIDEVRVYNRALSAAEIQADMTTAVGP